MVQPAVSAVATMSKVTTVLLASSVVPRTAHFPARLESESAAGVAVAAGAAVGVAAPVSVAGCFSVLAQATRTARQEQRAAARMGAPWCKGDGGRAGRAEPNLRSLPGVRNA